MSPADLPYGGALSLREQIIRASKLILSTGYSPDVVVMNSRTYEMVQIECFMADWWDQNKIKQPYEYWCRIKSLLRKNYRLSTTELIRSHKFPYHFTGEGP